MSQNISGTFVSEKVSKIRWRPDPFNSSHSFVTGSWDNLQENSIKLWDFQECESDTDIYPFVASSVSVPGDVTELAFLDADHFLASLSSGSVKLFKIAVDIAGGTYKIDEDCSWEKIHSLKDGCVASCNSFALYDSDIATVGEDGRLNLLCAKQRSVVRVLDKADSCSLNCVIFLKHNEVLTSNSRGQMKIWDLRSSEDSPSGTFMLSGEHVMATCLVNHPTQQHLLIAGDEEGAMTVWDLRHNTFPVNLLNAHNDTVNEIQFHPSYPDQIFSCSSAGEIWHWSSPLKSSRLPGEEPESFFLTQNARNNLEVQTIMPKLHKPVNSLDANRNRLVCGCDNEAVYVVNDVSFFS